nr:truncated InsB [Escherichia coli]
MPGNCPHYGRWPQHDFTSLKKLRPQSVTSRIQPGSDVIVCAEMDEQWGYVGAKSRQLGCFTRMTGSGRRLLRTYSVNARWRRGTSYEPAVTL